MGFQVEGKVALVTGANRGIGLSIVEELLDAGVSKVYAAVRKVDSVKELVENSKGRVVALEVDLTKPDTITAAAKTASDVELVINNAGVLKVAGPLADDAIEAAKFELDVNLFGLMRMAQAFIPVLKKQPESAFVQLNSVASLRSFPDFATYCLSKAASYSYTQALHDTVAADGIAVLSVHPGPIDTDMAQSAGLGDSVQPVTDVSKGIISALAAGDYHLFPDSMAKSLGEAYQSFATNVVEAEMAEG